MTIDWWTLALQTINVLILVWLLARFLFRPVSDIIARREQEAKKLLADAEAAKADVVRAKGEAEALRAETARERDTLVAEAHKTAEAEKAALAAKAADELSRQRAEAAALLERDREAAEKQLATRAAELSTDIAGKLLQRLPPADLLAAFLDGLCAEIRAQTPETRTALLAGNDGGALVLTTATPLDEAARARVTEAIAAALGTAAPLAFITDPSLIAGIELRGRHVAVRNSWQEDLARIRLELAREDQRPGAAG